MGAVRPKVVLVTIAISAVVGVALESIMYVSQSSVVILRGVSFSELKENSADIPELIRSRRKELGFLELYARYLSEIQSDSSFRMDVAKRFGLIFLGLLSAQLLLVTWMKWHGDL